MLLDLNDYYAASNLGRLYLARGEEGDAARADETRLATVRACTRALELGIGEDWARPTLLGCAFAHGDVEEVKRLLREVQNEGADAWKLETTLADLQGDVDRQQDEQVRARLAELLATIRLELGTGAAA